MTGFALLLPEIALLVGAFWALFAEVLPGGDRGACYAGALSGVAAAVLVFTGPAVAFGFAGLLEFSMITRFARIAVALLFAVWCVWLAGRGAGHERSREAVALAAFSAMGTMLVSVSAELITLFVALELATIPAYVLIGYDRRDGLGLEGALKYFLLSILTTLLMLYGFSFLYGVSRTSVIAQLRVADAGALGLLAVLLALVGLLAKLSAVPFHYWAPDAYGGSQPWAIAYASTVPKIGGAAILVRLVMKLAPQVPQLGTVIAVVAVASMVLGNLAALTQDDLRRMMAYSGVAHAGYLLLGVAALSVSGAAASIFYAVAYAIAGMAIMLLIAENGVTVGSWGDLAARRPVSAWASLLFLVSLIGIPPLAGFFGKLYLFTASAKAGLWVAVVVAVLMSVVSAGYYLRIVRSAFFAEPAEEPAEVPRSIPAAVALGILAAAVIGLGVFAGPILAWAGAVFG